jgi:hypothetical protein
MDISAEELLACTLQKLEEEQYPNVKLRLEQLLTLFNTLECRNQINKLVCCALYFPLFVSYISSRDES